MGTAVTPAREARFFFDLVQRKRITADEARRSILYEETNRRMAEEMFGKLAADAAFQFRNFVGYELEKLLRRAKT